MFKELIFITISLCVHGTELICWGNQAHHIGVSNVSTLLMQGEVDSFAIQGKDAVDDWFVAVAQMHDKSVVTWGSSYAGGNSSMVFDRLRSGVKEVYSGWTWAALKDDGSVVPWGYEYGSSKGTIMGPELYEKLSRDIVKVFNSWFVYVAVKTDGSVVTWGREQWGADISNVSSQLRNVVYVADSLVSMAALLADGTVVAWGAQNNGGNASMVQADLVNVTKIFGCGTLSLSIGTGGFAALKSDGSVVTWGGTGSYMVNGVAKYGCGNSSMVKSLLGPGSGIRTIVGNEGASMAAIKYDGTVVTWGLIYATGDTQAKLSSPKPGVARLYFSRGCNVDADWNCRQDEDIGSFVALMRDGTVLAWGSPGAGGDISNVSSKLNSGAPVVSIVQTGSWTRPVCFAALKADGTVYSWGGALCGGASKVQDLLVNVVEVRANMWAFAARRSDGSVVTWGRQDCGGDSSAVASQLQSGVIALYNSTRAFAALKADGTVVAWGRANRGGDTSAVASSLVGITRLFATGDSFCAVKGHYPAPPGCPTPSGGTSAGVWILIILLVAAAVGAAGFFGGKKMSTAGSARDAEGLELRSRV